jgi:hypothetical protein
MGGLAIGRGPTLQARLLSPFCILEYQLQHTSPTGRQLTCTCTLAIDVGKRSIFLFGLVLVAYRHMLLDKTAYIYIYIRLFWRLAKKAMPPGNAQRGP